MGWPLTALALVVGLLLPSTRLHAQDDAAPAAAAAATFLSPFPEADTYRLQVYGDGFAEGLLGGLIEAFGPDVRLQIAKKHKPVGALVRQEWEEDVKAEEASREVPHIGVIMLGQADRQNIRLGGGTKPLTVGSDEWQGEYGRRIDRLIRTLRKRAIAVYVVGQPPLRRPEANQQAEVISEVLKERALANGARFVEVTEAFHDESGNFTQFGPDIAGQRQKLRDGDGIGFTPAGNRKLASLIERDIRRDIAQAKSERAIPLVGNEAEQKRVNPSKAAAPAVIGGWKGAVTKENRAERKAAAAAQALQPAAPPVPLDTSGDQKADNGRLQLKVAGASGREEIVTIDIVRPAIPAAVISLLTRREVTEKAPQPGEAVIEDIGGGLSVVNSVSSLGDVMQGARGRKTAPTQTPQFTVLVKGERLPPQPGRADDFTWPRPEPAVVPPPQAAAPPPRTAPKPGPQPSAKGAPPQQR